MNLHEDVGVFLTELKIAVEREFHGYQGNRKALAE